ncbi:MAG: alpha-E domain-containing protein, partial [Gemmobacter sp.]
VVEARALMAFLPRLAKVVLGEPLLLPNIATWWCGTARERAFVCANRHRMVLAPALSGSLPFDAGENWPADDGDAEALDRRLEDEGASLIAQERVTISTAPAWQDGRLVPRPMSLRAFVVRTPDGWHVMPGGFARIGRDKDTAAIALQRGGSVADVWIMSDRPVPTDSMLPLAGAVQPRAEASVLPARAADNLYWLGRYVERTEHAVRLLRAYHLRLAETGTPEAPLLAALGRHLALLGFEPGRAFGPVLADRVAAARGCAAKVRDRFSVDGWASLGDLAREVAGLADDPAAGDDAARALGRLLHRLAAFTGLVHDNMYRFAAWRFLSLGRAVERADNMAWTLATFADPRAPDGSLDLAVEVGDSVMTHRRRFAVATSRATVIDLLALDEMNPRSVLYQLSEARAQLAHLPGNAPQGPLSPLGRHLLRLHTDLAVSTAEELTTARLLGLRAGIGGLSSLLGTQYFG